MDPSRLKEEMESSHAGNVSPSPTKPEVNFDGDFSEQEKMDTQSKGVGQGGKEKFVTDWFIE
jgi:hypothetical protein